MTFEYKVIDPGDASTERTLKELGKDGWELICKWGHYQLIFKRPKIEVNDEQD